MGLSGEIWVSEISDQETWKRSVAPTALAVCALLFPGQTVGVRSLRALRRFGGRLVLVPGEMGLVAEAAVEFAGDEVADAEFSEVGSVALIELLQRKIVFLDLVIAELEGFAVVNGGGDERAAVGIDTNAEFQSGGLVVGDEETVGYAGTIDEVHVERAIAGRRVNAAGHASAKGQLVGDGFGIFLEAIEEAGVLVKKDEENSSAE